MGEKQWFWATLTLSSITIVSVVFAAWELVENRYFRDANYLTLHYLYISRGIASSLVLTFWAAWFVLRQRRKGEEDLRRSNERYRGLLEDFPGGVILYDKDLRVVEWNASAERMYGYAKAEVQGHALPTVPPGKVDELREFMRRVDAGEPVLDVETTRLARTGLPFPVQLSLRPFRERRSAGSLPGGDLGYSRTRSLARRHARTGEAHQHGQNGCRNSASSEFTAGGASFAGAADARAGRRGRRSGTPGGRAHLLPPFRAAAAGVCAHAARGQGKPGSRRHRRIGGRILPAGDPDPSAPTLLRRRRAPEVWRFVRIAISWKRCF